MVLKRWSYKKWSEQIWIGAYLERVPREWVDNKVKMEGAVLSVTNNNNRFRTHLKNAASAICARTLPKQRRNEPAASSSARHHTYPRAAPTKRASISCRMEPLVCNPSHHAAIFEPPPESVKYELMEVQIPNKPNGTIKLKGFLAR